MRVIRILSTHPGQPATTPYPTTNGLMYELRAGDVAEPLGFGTNWFAPPFPTAVLRFFLHPLVGVLIVLAYWTLMGRLGLFLFDLSPWALLTMIPALLVTLPFVPGQYIAVRAGRFGFYIGSKIYGVDSPAYPLWLCDAADVFPGSMALCMTARFTRKLM
ncbi:MAG: hypothetical protein EG825_07760 [Rhodocyclaceae bacterium]|nr:hypothetical protein [Rhodocyclaceae bacterium]